MIASASDEQRVLPPANHSRHARASRRLPRWDGELRAPAVVLDATVGDASMDRPLGPPSLRSLALHLGLRLPWMVPTCVLSLCRTRTNYMYRKKLTRLFT